MKLVEVMVVAQAFDLRQSGGARPFDIDLCSKDLTEHGTCACNLSFFLIDVGVLSMPQVPIRMTAIEQLKNHYFADSTPPVTGWPNQIRLVCDGPRDIKVLAIERLRYRPEPLDEF
jgi:hypothetical protein